VQIIDSPLGYRRGAEERALVVPEHLEQRPDLVNALCSAFAFGPEV